MFFKWPKFERFFAMRDYIPPISLLGGNKRSKEFSKV